MVWEFVYICVCGVCVCVCLCGVVWCVCVCGVCVCGGGGAAVLGWGVVVVESWVGNNVLFSFLMYYFLSCKLLLIVRHVHISFLVYW